MDSCAGAGLGCRAHLWLRAAAMQIAEGMRSLGAGLAPHQCINASSLLSSPPHEPPCVPMQLCIVDGKAYEALAGPEPSVEDLDRVALLTNQTGSPLLAARLGAHDAQCHVLVPLARGGAALPDLSVTGSSEALLSGQKPPFALAARLVDAQGRALAGGGVRAAVSDRFVVSRLAGRLCLCQPQSFPAAQTAHGVDPRAPAGAGHQAGLLFSHGFSLETHTACLRPGQVATPRVRQASKKAIPHVDDHVSKLSAVGMATQAREQGRARRPSWVCLTSARLPPFTDPDGEAAAEREAS